MGLAFEHVNHQCRVAGAIEAGADADADDGGIAHESRDVLIFDGLGLLDGGVGDFDGLRLRGLRCELRGLLLAQRAARGSGVRFDQARANAVNRGRNAGVRCSGRDEDEDGGFLGSVEAAALAVGGDARAYS